MILEHEDKTVSIKIVYFGPALSGKTTSIKALFSHFGKLEQLSSIESTVSRTLFFDYGTITFQNTDWKLKVHIYTTTGQDFYYLTRPITAKATDGIIFVVDSQESVFERNILSWKELVSYYGEPMSELPIIIALNKQDLPNKFETARFLDTIECSTYKNLEMRLTIAISGEGILDCFEAVLNKIPGFHQIIHD